MLIGLTGGIACGKSTVLKIFEKKGFNCLSADDVVHKLLGPSGKAVGPVSKEFGDDLVNKPDSSIDRLRLGQIVFDDIKKRQALESILHPLVFDQFVDWKLKLAGKEAVYEIPLLFENSRQSDFDFTLCVSSDQGLQLERLIRRNAFTLEEAMKRINAQMPLPEKEALADFIIRNNYQDVSLLEKEVELLICKIKEKFYQDQE